MVLTLGLLFIVLLLVLAVPFWVAIGLGTIALLLGTGALPLSLLGEALFQGIDSFALIAIPLFVLTGDVMVRSGLANKLLDFAEATTGSMRSGFGTSTALGCGFFACISGSDAADAAAIGRITMDRLVERGYPKAYACALVASGACTGHPDSAVDRLHHHRFGAGPVVDDPVHRGDHPGRHRAAERGDHQHRGQPGARLRELAPGVLAAAVAPRAQRRQVRARHSGDHPGRHLFGRFHAHRIRGGRRRRCADRRHGAADGEVARLSGHARDFGARQRRHPADHRGGDPVRPGLDRPRRAAVAGHVD